MKKRKLLTYNLKIAGITENLEIVREFIHKLATKAGFEEEIAGQIELAVDEACTNVIRHAYKNDQRRKIDIKVILDTEKMQICISDKGKGFNPDTLPKPDLRAYVETSKRGGLGIHLMRSLMDEVQFQFNPSKKNTVTLTKYMRKKLA